MHGVNAKQRSQVIHNLAREYSQSCVTSDYWGSTAPVTVTAYTAVLNRMDTVQGKSIGLVEKHLRRMRAHYAQRQAGCKESW